MIIVIMRAVCFLLKSESGFSFLSEKNSSISGATTAKETQQTSLWSWVESVNTASGNHVVNNIKSDDVVDNASTFSSDLSILDESTDDDTSVDISDLSYDKDDDDEDSLTTVTYLSDFTIFFDDSEDEDTLTTVTSLSNFTADLFDEDDDNEDSLTTVTYMSDFTIFLDDSEDKDTLTTVTSLSNFTADSC